MEQFFYWLGAFSFVLLLYIISTFFVAPETGDGVETKLDPNLVLPELQEKLRQAQEELIKSKADYQTLLSQKKSSEVRIGFLAEKLSPFLEPFPYKKDTDEIQHMGNPVDLIVFRQDEIVFVEIKSGGSVLSKKQRNIRDLVKSGKVRFETHIIDETGYKIK